ncbi:MAG: sn-glycerol-3-phosphate ABC transporter ATP-binding protein UgpC [Pelagibacteraceae bacterium]|jgi:multiple sugar transport system ATP-binding protein|nr:sn-glycerol-3-phosphate ABC transporter ATP-binding protein UgpC [Pelagibacteraceae bacterium]MBT3902168.1 sn-glycerol-3-phosphate ABC transporter ATP-binding protein UgpC [Pelagibacteraceae bacterium]MBT4646198.1 sn-glycerol-3-phosphate ABC transporter ATP-binding protein UgpC [Pelagibacteraceae bacterium]MBT4950160.1 sn-glycerol-3-phosphate ABC transporter ATP-binding protein UgpC [Pelagibacteraceae bacterium]MBT5214570.1 sn-glycerol-3-phosphate ABC transporter ATP-binding protein UgpC [Pe
MAKVTLEKVSKFYGNVEAVKKIDLEITDNEFLVLVGPSGCGKSSTLRMIAGLEEIDEGKIIIGEKTVNELEPRERNVSMVFQNYALYPHMTVEENLGFSLKIAGMQKNDIDKRVAEAAGILDIDEFLQRKPAQLSGGQRQRVAMGRAIVRRPDVFLFDEPLSNLDAKLRNQMRTEIKRLHQKVKTTIVYVTHDQVEAMTLADRIVIMKDGIIEQIGTPLELFETPATKFVATFIGSPSMNMISSTIKKDQEKYIMITEDGLNIPVPKSKQDVVKEGQKISFGFRAEDIVPLKFGNKPSQSWGHKSKVNLSEPLGTETLIFTNFGKIEIVSRMFTPELVRAGDELDFALNLERTYLFDDETGKAL